MDTRMYKKGEFIYFAQDASNKIYYLESGTVKISAYSDDGREVIKAILHPGEIFGELGLLGEQTRGEFAQALQDAALCVMTLEMMRNLMRDYKEFGLEITRLIGNKLVKTQRRLESLVFKDARMRIIEFLTDLATERGQPLGYEILVREFFTHQDIANLTGTSRQTVTTVLNELRNGNLIYFTRKKLIVRDLKKLQTLTRVATN
ncbi:Crp/Fnr family transcriptional regulator [Sphingobacteriales bacterium UPWRP_1]|nr:hypothetical protein B6N25_04850 [Sphingobacteriales bacterium TSM_CSS]PSJ78330.1 Crp/Fnr family transcriptional regulator [Sphingobacteriales bacterium UPWRP_1]